MGDRTPPRRPAGRPATAFLAFALLPMLAGASATSKNFEVEAPSPDVARKVADWAEYYRAVIAKQWLGEPLPDWRRPCRVRVRVTGGEAGGVTSFGFGRGGVTDQEMEVEGRLDRIIASALPHEITHTIFAAHFNGPLPRWADEGASLLSEDRRERLRHEGFAETLLSRTGGWALPDLFAIDEYPDDLMGFYGQGYSVSRFLVEIGGIDGRPRFLRFLKDGMEGDWDAATRAHYGFADAKELDRAWRAWHAVAARSTVPSRAPGDAVVVRAASSGDAVVRAQSPDERRTR